MPFDRKTKVAVLVRGGVSPIDRAYQSIRRTPQEVGRVSIEACFSSIQKNLVSANPEADFDFIVHSWQVDMAKALDETFAPVKSKYVENSTFRKTIFLGVLKSRINALVKSPRFAVRALRHPFRSLAQDVSGISQAISIREVCRLFTSFCEAQNRSYDLVVILRPDVVILGKVTLGDMMAGAVRCNNYGDRCGDFRWVLPPTLVPKFTDLFSSIFSLRRVHEPHLWIRDYFDHIGVHYYQDEIRAGQDEEVLRKTRGNGVSFSKLMPFGLTRKEYDSYPG